MKKLYIILFGLFLVCGAMAQPDQPCSTCLPQGITFSNQSQIDNFQVNYPNCTNILGNVTIQGDDIINLNGLSVLISIEGYLVIKNNSLLTSLVGFDNLTTIGDYLLINDNTPLISTMGLENLTSIGGDLRIVNNSNLTNLTGFNNLASVGGILRIRGNNAIATLTGLNNLASTGSDLVIGYCNSLTILTGLESITYIGGDLRIYDNQSLHSLAGLENLNFLGGSLLIDRNNALTSMTGLDNLTNIGDYLSIKSNNALTNLTGLDNLINIGGYLSINSNNTLISLTGLNNLNSFEGTLGINNNPSLTSLTGLENITSIGGNLWISGNSLLTSLTGLHNLTSIAGRLEITNNYSLSACDFEWLCEYLSAPNGQVDISGNAPGCKSVIEVANNCGEIPCLPFGNYHFHSQSDIDIFPTVFPNCTDLQGDVIIYGNNIMDLSGLDVVNSIGRDLYVIGNEILESLTGIDNIDAGSIDYLTIIYNSSLSTCAVQSICDYLAAPNGWISIYGNATGCNSQQEVEAACLVGEEESAVGGRRSAVNLYPNPTRGIVNCQFGIVDFQRVTLKVFDLCGREVAVVMDGELPVGEHLVSFDMSALPQGVYLVRVVSDNGVSVGKVVKR